MFGRVSFKRGGGGQVGICPPPPPLENDLPPPPHRKMGSESKLTNYLKIVQFCIMNHNYLQHHTAILLFFLFHTSTISSKSVSLNFSGDSIEIFMR